MCFATFLAACAATDGSADEATGGGGGKADGQAPTIVFDDAWHETASGALLAGDRMRVDYDLDRLTACRGSTNGSEVWGVTGYASFDGGAPVAFGVSQLSGGRVEPVIASVDIPATATSVELWFAINNRWGCIAYDSNDNQNYRFAIEHGASGAVLAFDADWTESQSRRCTPAIASSFTTIPSASRSARARAAAMRRGASPPAGASTAVRSTRCASRATPMRRSSPPIRR